MRCRTSWKSFALGLTLLGMAGSAQAELRLVETVEVLPTTSVVALPRTYVVPTTYLATTPVYATSYVSGTSYVLPTSAVYNVVPTSYTYVPTTYVSPRYRWFWPRRYYETTYVSSSSRILPTYYVSPTQYVRPTTYLLPTSSVDVCCDLGGTAAPAPVIRVNPELKPSGVQKSAGNTIESRPVVDSTVAAEPDYRSEANKPARDDSIGTTQGQADAIDSTVAPSRGATGSNREALKSSAVIELAPAPAAATSKTVPTKTTVPAPAPAAAVPAPTAVKPSATKDTSKFSVIDPGKAIPPPVSPPLPSAPNPLDPSTSEGPPPLDTTIPPLPEPKDDVTRRDSLKPVLSSAMVARKNVLEGRILSADTLKGEYAVQVVVSDRSGRFLDRFTRTDAAGHFAMSLPEGDWTIKVTMPSGRIMAVEQGQVTATGGKVLDMYGRDLKNLVIQR